MRLKLTKPDALLLIEFENLNNFSDVADLLEVPRKTLWKRVIESKTYSSFKIRKKNSDQYRIINKPSKNLAIIQKKLNYILNLKYNSSHKASHGFEKEKSIRTNAECHLKRNLILNLDIKDYFSSINFARVRAMFMSYFKFNNEVATTLANICCDNNNVLPQGAATSPMISNIISYKLDKQLDRFAKRYGCVYTRYADDLTFSTNRREFPKEIVSIEEEAIVSVSTNVERIIKANGFEINTKKTRLSDSSKAKYVTGVKVNTKLNVNRDYIRRIRSILHTIEKNVIDLDAAVKIFNEKYPFRDTYFKVVDMFNVLRGMISHVGHIKGKQDEIYRKFVGRYNAVIKVINETEGQTYSYLYLPYTKSEFRKQNVFVIEEESISYEVGGYARLFTAAQGSAFLLKGFGLVTNWHVIKPYIQTVILDEFAKFTTEYYIPITKSKYADDLWFAKIIAYDKPRDIAILKIDGIDEQQYGFDYSLNIEEGMNCCLLGYPEYVQGQMLHEVEGKIQSQRINRYHPNEYIRYTTTMPIIGGNSGGPLVDSENSVIAIAVKGADNTISEVIPINGLLESIKKGEMERVENHNIVDAYTT